MASQFGVNTWSTDDWYIHAFSLDLAPAGYEGPQDELVSAAICGRSTHRQPYQSLWATVVICLCRDGFTTAVASG